MDVPSFVSLHIVSIS